MKATEKLPPQCATSGWFLLSIWFVWLVESDEPDKQNKPDESIRPG
jgi:hypothetical protein